MIAFNVYKKNKLIDTVFTCDGHVTKDEMKKSLVEHDGYDPDIRVTKARKNPVR